MFAWKDQSPIHFLQSLGFTVFSIFDVKVEKKDNGINTIYLDMFI